MWRFSSHQNTFSFNFFENCYAKEKGKGPTSLYIVQERVQKHYGSHEFSHFVFNQLRSRPVLILTNQSIPA
jgi:hypothetical protein